ncbi:XdhC family protein [Pseudomarimonas salicorniae]|uniref:XdhC family protein n=1 Tax=Pseudomarimonas salicorniae TaxID=2933270 RepID=A0ABT0GDD7_9GAMM|nr:XdhC family protein [Lysobacter sp. CAU 1642]MCK7592352.1 XdhC family protein [Lysobacter sp. CAU 1642]
MDIHPSSLAGADGGAPEVLRCLRQQVGAQAPCVLALVCEVDGSAYVAPGTLLLFGQAGRLRGWVSGGCLERHIEERAAALIAEEGVGEWIELDQRDDAALLAPSASGCRGRIRLRLLGPRDSARCAALAELFLSAGLPMRVSVDAQGSLSLDCGDTAMHSARLALPWPGPLPDPLLIRPAPRVLLLGAGAESPLLIPQLRALGWRVEACEQRPRWLPLAAGVDRLVEAPPERGLALLEPREEDAVLVMHHDFERDRAALAALAGHPCRWIGLLGPRRRRDDLLRLLGEASAALAPRLEAPVGLDLGGKGPAAIALSIAASLQRWRHAD